MNKKFIRQRNCKSRRRIFIRRRRNFKIALIPPRPLANFEIQEYYKNEPRFNGVYSRNNLPKLKKGAYVINLDHSKTTGTHWVVIFVKSNEVIYFDSYGVENILEEIKKLI